VDQGINGHYCKFVQYSSRQSIVILREVSLTNWGQAGIVASDPEFLAKSRITELPSKQKV
jgi:hypothetical protein